MTIKNCKVLIVEDELLIADNIQAILENEGISVCGIAMSYEKALFQIETQKPDLILLDIQLKGKKTGIDVAKWVLNNVQTPVLFLTSQENEPFVTNAIETSPIAYLIKPISPANLLSSIKLAFYQQTQKEQAEFINLKVGNKILPIEVNSIVYIKSDHVYIEVHTTDNKHLVRSTMDQILNQLGATFIQCHRGYALNKLFIEKISSTYVILKTGDEFPVSRKFRNDVKNISI